MSGCETGRRSTSLCIGHDDGFDSGDVRELISKQDPQGVKDYSRIARCYCATDGECVDDGAEIVCLDCDGAA